MSIVNVQNFSYQHSNREFLFKNIGIQINQGQKIALVGRNGIGKTTLLEAIYNNDPYPEIKVEIQSYYMPQHIEKFNEQTIAEILGVDKIIHAINAIEAGEIDQKYFDTINNNWDIESKINIVFDYWGLYNIDLNTPLKEISGGEQVKVFLCGITLHQPLFVILDEPTNHLDSASRDKLYQWIEEISSTLLIVSHDRYLLNLLSDIYELSSNKVSYYPGNYDNYLNQKESENEALHKQINNQRLELKKAKKIQQEVAERRQRQESRGKTSTAKKSLPRIIANARKSAAQNTSAELADKHSKKINDLSQSIRTLQERADFSPNLKIQIEDSDLHLGKILVEADDINYAYADTTLWATDLSLRIQSGERISVKGKNGSGKTTLIKLITKQIAPNKGIINIADFDYMYLDQNYSLIDISKSVYQQAQSYNIDMPEHEVKMHLARSLFSSESWDKSCSVLSGGEKMKLSLCSLIISNNIPDMLILDEPTNNLDIESMFVLSSAISEYSGTIVLISHDKYFIEDVGIDYEIDLDSHL